MPRAFTETEKETIRGRLIESGRECFGRYGLAKTTIEDLVKPARIAKASFYLFYESKEALYVETVIDEIPAMMERLLDASFRTTNDTRDALVLLMKAMVQEIETNPITRVLLGDPSDLDRLTASLDIEKILRQASTMFAPLIDEIRKAQAQGEIVAGDPQELLYTLGLIKMYPVNKRRVPEPIYNTMLDRSARVIADGLTCPAKAGRVGRPTARTSRRQAPAIRKENPVSEMDSPARAARATKRAARKKGKGQ
ncbi:MAG: TetR/AcrR family transcriptional regulator [Candidatus Bipolaricaulota bacterium]|nr:TetR/AcrR family transcriptional regulator [Candidatus Bipolaricaulota bacterium]